VHRLAPERLHEQHGGHRIFCPDRYRRRQPGQEYRPPACCCRSPSPRSFRVPSR
jgi:hypothetical protein